MKKVYEEHNDWFVSEQDQKNWFDSLVYDQKQIDAHLYGVDKMIFDAMELDTEVLDWDTFCSGAYAIVSSMSEGRSNDSEFALYQVGEKIPVELPSGKVKEYEVIAIGDVPYSMGPKHSHGMDVYVTIPSEEYRKVVPDSKGAMQLFMNLDKEHLQEAESYVEQYCETVDTNTMVSITEANQNFSKVARLVDELGSVVILKNNAPRYLVIDFSKADDSAIAKDEDVLEISKRLLAQNKEAYEVLAK